MKLLIFVITLLVSHLSHAADIVEHKAGQVLVLYSTQQNLITVGVNTKVEMKLRRDSFKIDTTPLGKMSVVYSGEHDGMTTWAHAPEYLKGNFFIRFKKTAEILPTSTLIFDACSTEGYCLKNLKILLSDT